jgi:GGDEF domain-containing protein
VLPDLEAVSSIPASHQQVHIHNAPMAISEIVVWSAMAGGIITIFLMALADAVGNRNTGTLLNPLFVLITGASCVVITGLPEALFPMLPDRPLMILKGSLGPLAGSISLYLLGRWLGGLNEDVLVHRLTAWGGVEIAVTTLVLVGFAAWVPEDRFLDLLWVTAGVNLVPVAIAMAVVRRSDQLGDPLARWMTPSIVCLSVMTVGLYMKGLQLPGPGLGVWAFVATVTVVYFLISTILVVLRVRQRQKLARLLRMELGADPVTGLPTGVALLSKIEHSLWRAARLRSESTVICIYVSNLYELAHAQIEGVDHQILSAMAARIRRGAGFRCIIGQYHPRCFVVAMSTDRHSAHVKDVIDDLRAITNMPLALKGEWASLHTFRPCVGVGSVKVITGNVRVADVVNVAEQRAQLDAQRASSVPVQSDIPTVPGTLNEPV